MQDAYAGIDARVREFEQNITDSEKLRKNGYVPFPNRPFVAETLRYLALSSDHVTIWGAGFGLLLPYIAVAGFHATGIESSTDLVERGKAFHAGKPWESSISLKHGNYYTEAYQQDPLQARYFNANRGIAARQDLPSQELSVYTERFRFKDQRTIVAYTWAEEIAYVYEQFSHLENATLLHCSEPWDFDRTDLLKQFNLQSQTLEWCDGIRPSKDRAPWLPDGMSIQTALYIVTKNKQDL